MIRTYLQILVNYEDKGWLEENAATIGTVVVILLFLIERLLSVKEKTKDRKTNWYHSVIVLPHLSSINDFFLQYSKKAQDVYSQVGSGTRNSQILLLQSKTIYFKQLKDIIQNFEFEFLRIVYTFNLERYNSLMQILNDIHEEVVIILDKQNLSDSDLETLLHTIKNKKSLFFDEMYKEMTL